MNPLPNRTRNFCSTSRIGFRAYYRNSRGVRNLWRCVCRFRDKICTIRAGREGYHYVRYRYRAVRPLLAFLLPLHTELNYSSPSALRPSIACVEPDSEVEVNKMRKNQNSPHRPPSWILLLSFLIAGATAALAQSGDRAARAALWDSYQL